MDEDRLAELTSGRVQVLVVSHDEAIAMASELLLLRRKLAERDAALKPFADAADSLNPIADEGAVIWGSDPLVQVRHFRAARSALGEPQ